MKNILEVFKANKKQIIIKSLIVGGVIAGLKLVEVIAKSNSNEEEVVEVIEAETINEEKNEEQ